MTGSTSEARPSPSRNETAARYFEHSNAQRVNTDAVVVEALRSDYPELHISVVPQYQIDLFGYASAGHASLASIDREKDRLSWKGFFPPATRLSGQRGALVDQVKLGRYLFDWQGKEYILCVADGRDGTEPYPQVVNQYILSASIEATNKLLFEAGVWNSELHNEIWVFDGGWWQKSAELWASVHKSHWEDVILDEDMKKAVIADVENFFDSRDTYERLKVSWKRGIIYYGPPGNGKTVRSMSVRG